MKRLFLALSLSMLSLPSLASVEVFAENEFWMPVKGMIDSPIYTYDNIFEGATPYFGKVGLKYSGRGVVYSGGYFYNSDTDLKEGNKYSYSGLFIKITMSHCVYMC